MDRKDAMEYHGGTAPPVVEADIVLQHTGWSHFTTPSNNRYHYAITGEESQIVTIRLDGEGDQCQGEPGTMVYLTDGIRQNVTCEGCCERMCSGESCCVINFIHQPSRSSSGMSHAYAALTPNFPTAKVIPVDLSSPHVNGTLICQQGAYMASCGNVSIRISLDCNFMRCCCGGLGMIRQKVEGDGMVFLAGTGTMVQKVLAEGEIIVADTNCIMAFAESCHLDIRRTGGLLGMVGGGEGFFNTTLTGPGLVILQSMNESTFRQALIANKVWRR